jgi:small-conductance mechanosensitive channel
MTDVSKGFIEGLLGSSQLSALEQLGWFGAKITLALAIAAVALFVAARVRSTINYIFRRHNRDLGLAILLGRLGFFGILFVGLLLVLPVFGLNATVLFATFGVAGLAVSLAMQDVLRNAIAGIYLLLERPFRPGDVIKVRDFVGVVETVNLRTTTLRADGEIVYIPNSILIAEALINRGYPATPAKE